MLMAKKNTDSGKAVYKRNVAKRVEDFRYLSHRIIEFANRGIPKVEFLHEILNILHEFSGCDGVDLWLRETDYYFHGAINRDSDFSIIYDSLAKKDYEDGKSAP